MPIEVEKADSHTPVDSSQQHTDQTTQSEDLLIRNYDVDDPHQIKLVVQDEDGQQVFENTYVLQPGETESECDVLRSGTYTVTVRCDGRQQEQLELDIGQQLEKTAVIELGNGIVSITQGLF